MTKTQLEALDELLIATEDLCPGCSREVALVVGDEGLELHVECDCGSAFALT